MKPQNMPSLFWVLYKTCPHNVGWVILALNIYKKYLNSSLPKVLILEKKLAIENHQLIIIEYFACTWSLTKRLSKGKRESIFVEQIQVTTYLDTSTWNKGYFQQIVLTLCRALLNKYVQKNGEILSKMSWNCITHIDFILSLVCSVTRQMYIQSTQRWV